jgi:DNA-binding transcriptional LysR family regulator
MEGIAHLVLSGEYLGYLPTHYAARWVEQGALRQLGGQALSYQATLSLVTRPGAPKEALLALIEDLSGLARAPQTKNPAGAGSDTDIN